MATKTATDSQLATKELLIALKRHYGAASRVERETGIPERTLRSWTQKPWSIKPDAARQVREAAAKVGIVVSTNSAAPRLYDWSMSYEQNQKRDLGTWPERDPSILHLNRKFLGRHVGGLTGASASVLTSNAELIRFLGHFGCFLITFKTVRSKPHGPHPWPNLYPADPKTKPLEALFSSRDVIVGPVADWNGKNNGWVNRFGIPCSPVADWQVEFARAKSFLGPDHILILSVVGTAEGDDSAEDLIADFAEVVRLARTAGADYIELNLSCPNVKGREGMVFQNVDLSAKICAAARGAAGKDMKILAKVGYLGREALDEFVVATADYVDGWTVTNTFPVRAMKLGQDGLEEVYPPGIRAGLSGPPIFQLVRECVANLSDVRLEQRLSDKAIVAVGGVSTAADVASMLDAGADAVQMTSVFLENSLFGVEAHNAVARWLADRGKNADERIENGMRSWLVACEELGLADSPGDLAVAASVFFEWKRTCQHASAARMAKLAGSVEYFRDAVRIALSRRP